MVGLSASQFAFVLSFLISLALVLALSVTTFLGRSWWRWLCLALSLALSLSILSYFFASTLPISSLFFGFLAALGTSQLLLYGKSQATIAASLPWLIIFLFSLIAGLYPHISASLFSGLREARIETTGVHLILAEDRSRDAKLPVFEFDDRPLVTARTWPYKSGTQSLLNLTDDILDETTTLSHYCTLKAFEQFCDAKDSGATQHFLNATRDYFTAIRPFVQCLAAYGKRFPNGLPIQDELSEIAMTFARRDKPYDVNAPQLDNDLQALVSNIVAEVADTPMPEQARKSAAATLQFNDTCKARLQQGLSQFYGEHLKTTNRWISPDYEKRSSTDCERMFSTQDEKLGCKI